MISEWRELSTLTTVFYIGGFVSFIGLVVMILTGLASIGYILAWKWKLLKLCRAVCDPSRDAGVIKVFNPGCRYHLPASTAL